MSHSAAVVLLCHGASVPPSATWRQASACAFLPRAPDQICAEGLAIHAILNSTTSGYVLKVFFVVALDWLGEAEWHTTYAYLGTEHSMISTTTSLSLSTSGCSVLLPSWASRETLAERRLASEALADLQIAQSGIRVSLSAGRTARQTIFAAIARP